MHSDLPDKDQHDAQLSVAARFFKNVAINLSATGAAAVLIAWLIALVAVSIWGSDRLGPAALGLLGIFGGTLFIVLGQKLR
jgi:hypothetical protein